MSDELDPRAKFREALEKKKSSSKPSNQSKKGKSKVQRGKSSGSSPKMFRRKSGAS